MKLIKLTVLLLILILYSYGTFAQGLNLQWAFALTSPGGVRASKIVNDEQGNIFVAGSFSGTVDFDPGAGTNTLTADTAFGLGTYYLAKYNPAGNLLFVRQLSVSADALTRDHAGNICMTGYISGTEDLDPGPGTATFQGNVRADIHITRLDAAGNFINALVIGGPGSDGVNSIAVDATNNIYITGAFRDSVDFDPGPGVTLLRHTGVTTIFLAKYSPSGSLLFAFRLISNGNGSDEGVCLAVDAAQQVHLGGRFLGNIDLDPGTGTAAFTSRGLDGFLATYDAGGNYIYGFNLDGNVYDLQLDRTDNLWVTGTYPDSMDADPGPGRAMIYSVNNFDVYIAKYSSAGNYIHARGFESDTIYTPTGLVLMGSGSAYTYGRFPATADFNPGGSGGTIASSGVLDGYVAKYTAGGAFLQALPYGATGDDRLHSISIDPQGNIWMAGYFTGTIDFDPGPGTAGATSTVPAAYIARFRDDETATTGISSTTRQPAGPRIFGKEHAVIVDFTALSKVDAQVTITNLLGQPIATARHTNSDMLKLDLPDRAGQLCIVVVDNGGKRTTQKILIQ